MSFNFGNVSDRAKLGFMLAVSVPAVYFSVKKLQGLTKKKLPERQTPKTPEAWSSADVQQWLQSIGVSSEARLCFAENDIDGSILLSLREDHLSTMGVKKLKDRLLFRKCVAALAGPARAAATAQAEAADGSDASSDEASPPAPRQVSQQRPPAAAATAARSIPPTQQQPQQQQDAAAAQSGAVAQLLSRILSTCEVLESDDFKRATPEVQRRIADEAQKQLADLPRILLALPPADQGSLLPAAQRLKAAILATRTQQQSSELQAATAKFSEMLDTFEQMLSAEEFEDLDVQRRKDLIATITSQLQRIGEVAQQLPGDVGTALKVKIQRVARLCEANVAALSAPPPPPSPPAATNKQQLSPKRPAQPSPQKQHASADFLLQRLKAIFNMLQDPKLLQLDVAQRSSILAKLRADLESIGAEAQHLPSEQRGLVSNVVEGALAVVDQLDGIAEKEEEVQRLTAAGAKHKKATAAAQAAAGDDEASDVASVELHGQLLGGITDMLKNVLTTIKSKTFAAYSKEEQHRVASALEDQLEQSIPALKRLPASSQKEVIPLFSKMADLLGAVKKSTSAAAALSSTQATTADADGDSEESMSSNDVADAFLTVTEILKSTLATVKSEEFAAQPASGKFAMATALQKRLTACKSVINALPANYQEQVAPLHIKLSDLVKAILLQTSGNQQQQQQPAAGSVSPRKAASPSASTAAEAAAAAAPANGVPFGASQRFQMTMTQLRKIFDLLNSDKFEQAPVSVKSRVSGQLLQQLDEIEASLTSQPEEERAALLELIQPISRMLQQIAAIGASATAAGTAPGSTAESTKASLSREQVTVVAQNLSEMMQLIKSSEFQNAAQAERTGICTQLLTHLKKMEPMIEAMQEVDQRNILPVFKPLAQLLVAIANGTVEAEAEDGLNEDEAEEREGAEENGDDDQDSDALSGVAQEIFKSVEQLYNIAQSPRFLDAEPARRSALALAMVQECSKLGERCEDEPGCAPLQPLIRELKTALSLHVQNASAGGKQQQQKAAAPDAAKGELHAPKSILEKLKKLYTIAKSPQFLQAPAEEQLMMAEALLRECTKLEAECQATPGAQAVLPYVSQLRSLLRQVMGDGDDGEGNDEEPAEAPEDLNETPEQLRHALYQAIKASTHDLQQGKRVTFEELKDLIGLLDDLDAVGIRTDEEINARQAFHQELEKAIARAKDDVEQQAQDLENTPLESASDVTAKTRLLAKSFIEAHDQLQSTAQLAPFMQKLENILSEADAAGIDWQHNQQTAKIVGTLMTLFEQQRERLSLADPRTESDMEVALRNAAERLEGKGDAATREDVSRAIDVMETCQEVEGQLTTEDLMAYKDLQETILRASTALSSKSQPRAAAAASTAKDSGSLSPRKAQTSAPTGSGSPSKVELLLRDTQAKLERSTDVSREDLNRAIDVLEACDGVSAQMTTEDLTAYKDLQDAILKASSRLSGSPAAKGAAAAARQPPTQSDAAVGADGAMEPNDMAKSMLVQMLNSLRSGRLSEEQLAPMALFLERFKTMQPQGKLLQAVEVIEGLIERQREQNADDDSDEGIPGGYINELSLVPRILERLKEADFVAETTLFEIQCISKILMHLASSSVVQRNEELQAVVKEAQRMFSEHVTNYNGSAKDPASVTCPLAVTGMAVEDSSEETTTAFSLFSAEESEDFTVNEAFVASRLLREPTILPPCDEALLSEWDAKSAAILFCIPQYPEGPENGTALSELMVLHDVLDKRFGFDLVSIADPNATAESLLRVVEDVVASNPSRLLVYYHTPRPQCIAPTPHAVTFSDSSALTHAKLFERTQGVARVVVVHDNSRQLEVAATLNGVRSANLCVALTDGAAAVANTSRCWLYDGVFTPIVVELLSKDHIDVLCPDDLVTYAAAALLGKTPVLFGPRSKDAALCMPFLAPFDDGTEEPTDVEQ